MQNRLSIVSLKNFVASLNKILKIIRWNATVSTKIGILRTVNKLIQI